MTFKSSLSSWLRRASDESRKEACVDAARRVQPESDVLKHIMEELPSLNVDERFLVFSLIDRLCRSLDESFRNNLGITIYKLVSLVLPMDQDASHFVPKVREVMQKWGEEALVKKNYLMNASKYMDGYVGKVSSGNRGSSGTGSNSSMKRRATGLLPTAPNDPNHTYDPYITPSFATKSERDASHAFVERQRSTQKRVRIESHLSKEFGTVESEFNSMWEAFMHKPDMSVSSNAQEWFHTPLPWTPIGDHKNTKLVCG